MYIFGGNDIRIGAMNNLWQFDLGNLGDLSMLSRNNRANAENPIDWKECKMHGSIPGTISHHQTVVAGKNMYLIGGCMGGRDYNQSQMYRLDLQTLNWDQVGTRSDSDCVPQQIDEHTVAQDGNLCLIFGGFENGCRSNKIYSFDLETLKWNMIKPTDAKAKSPMARAGHSMNMINNCLYIFGGKNDENQKMKDLWKFDLESLTWTELIPTNSHDDSPN